MSVAIITAEVKEGASIEQVADSMHSLTCNFGCNVKFCFEEVEMVVNEWQLPDFIITEWKRRKAIQQGIEQEETKPQPLLINWRRRKPYGQ